MNLLGVEASEQRVPAEQKAGFDLVTTMYYGPKGSQVTAAWKMSVRLDPGFDRGDFQDALVAIRTGLEAVLDEENFAQLKAEIDNLIDRNTRPVGGQG